MATLTIELPDPIYEALSLRAELGHRSVSQEAIQLLTKMLDVEAPRSILELQGLGTEVWGDTDAVVHVQRERGSWD